MRPHLPLSVAVAACAAASTAAAQDCSRHTGATVTPLVELYTSEGCSSCPPADRWLSRWQAHRDVVALAYHVNYWDHLGWRDRFGSAAFSERQVLQQRVNGARHAYTPQVVIDGRDRPDWPGAQVTPRANALASIALRYDGSKVVAQVDALAGAPALLAGWWALTEDGHASHVRAGENAGETLRHDFVVRELRPVAAWNARPSEPLRIEFAPAITADPRHPRRFALIVTDAASGRPLQSLQIGPC